MSEVSFGPFLLDPSSTRLTRDGVDVKLRPQAFQALRTLLRHSGQSIGYEQMMAPGDSRVRGIGSHWLALLEPPHA
jgi:DNA-binding winged helix-turn-helix (wHTH) protein